MLQEMYMEQIPQIMDLDEEALLQQAQSGDDEAFGALVLKLEMAVRRFIRRLIGISDAEDDIVQDTFIALYRHLEDIDLNYGLRPYLFRIVRNRCYDELRKQGRYEILSLDEEPVETYASFSSSAHDQPEEVAHWLLIQLEVREAIDRLPELQRQALILYSEEALTYAEIAEVMNTSLGTIKSRLFHAKRNLRRLLRPEIVEALNMEFA